MKHNDSLDNRSSYGINWGKDTKQLASEDLAGKGKSFTGMTMAYVMALQGVQTVFIDPKGDSLPMEYIPGLEGHLRVFDL